MVRQNRESNLAPAKGLLTLVHIFPERVCERPGQVDERRFISDESLATRVSA